MPKSGNTVSQTWRTLTILLVLIGVFGLSDEFLAVLNFLDKSDTSYKHWHLWTSIATLCAICVLVIYVIYRGRNSKKMLENLEKNFLAFMEGAADMLLISSMDGHIIDANRRTCELLGYSREEILSHSLWDVDIDCYLRQHPHTRFYLERGRTISYETWYRTRSGHRFPVESRVRKAFWHDKPCLIEIVRDISVRRQAEDALQESKAAVERARNLLETRMLERTEELQKRVQERNLAEKRARDISTLLADVIDYMPSILITIDTQRKVTHWNQQAVEISGISAQQAVGKSLKTLLPYFDVHIDAMAEASRFGQERFATRIQAKINERNYLLDVVIYPLRVKGRGVVIRVDDITEKVRMEQILVQSEKMMSLGGLAAGMAHEINNPLGAVIQSAQNIERRININWTRNHEIAKKYELDLTRMNAYLEQQRIPQFLTGIREAGERAAAIVADMLSFARPGSGDSVKVDVGLAMDSAIRLATTDYNQKKHFDFRQINIVKQYAAEPVLVKAQKNQLEQVFLNLLTNAAQAMSDAGTQNPQLLLSIYSKNNHVVAEVSDNGPGMDEHVKRRVFEPFFTTKDEGKGTGLGLSVSYFIITDQLHGQFEVESEIGKGTHFRITLPAIAQESNTPTTPQIELPL